MNTISGVLYPSFETRIEEITCMLRVGLCEFELYIYRHLLKVGEDQWKRLKGSTSEGPPSSIA